jgi:hypothetical protein
MSPKGLSRPYRQTEMPWNHRIHSFLPMQYSPLEYMGADAAGRQDQNQQSDRKLRFRFGCLLIALGLSRGVVLPFAAQNRNQNKPTFQLFLGGIHIS